MAKINVVLADTDELYLNRLTNYIIEKTDSFNVSSFSAKEFLNKYLTNPSNKIDLLIITEDFISDSIKELDIPAKVLLSQGVHNQLEGFEVVNKYQKADKFISDILLIFAERTGRTDAVSQGNKNTKMIALYSPIGGCGKTTIALALSTFCASSGYKVFYLNFEKTDSSNAFFEAAPGGNMSDVLLALKTKGANVGLKIISNRYVDPTTKINYINSADSAMEYNELSDSEVARLLKEFDTLGEYDMVFIDAQGVLDNYTLNILSSCDSILIPFGQDRLSLAKMTSFLKEFKYHESLSSLKSKIHLIANKTDAKGTEIIQSSSIVQFKPVEVFLPYSPVFADIKNLAYAGNLNQTALVSIVNILMQS